jgi:hypothetical protein
MLKSAVVVALKTLKDLAFFGGGAGWPEFLPAKTFLNQEYE